MWPQQKIAYISLYQFPDFSMFHRGSSVLPTNCPLAALKGSSTRWQPIVTNPHIHAECLLLPWETGLINNCPQSVSQDTSSKRDQKKIKQTKQNITKKDFISCRGADKCHVLHTSVRICYLNPGILSAFILKIFRLSTNWFVLMFPHKTQPLGWDNGKQREPPPLRHRLNRLFADLKCCQSKQT